MTAGCVVYLRLVAAVGFGGETVLERRFTLAAADKAAKRAAAHG